MIHPLRILKQVVTTFVAINRAGEWRQPLKDFLLDRYSQGFPDYRVFAYMTLDERSRLVGWAENLSLKLRLTEFSHPPFGYVVTDGDEPPRREMVELTSWVGFKYDESVALNLAFPLLPTASPFPGVYRTKAELAEFLADYETVVEPVADQDARGGETHRVSFKPRKKDHGAPHR